jgi:hypothetical protein
MHIVLISAMLAAPALAGCQAAPRARPVKMGPVDTGLESVEAARRQLKGTWELVSLDVFSPSGERQAAQASGQLTYDEFGNLAMKGTITGGAQIDPSALNLTGRVAIDPVAHTLKITAVDAASTDDRRVDPKLDASKVRYYEFAGDLLKTTVKDASGKTTATATWKRAG